MYNLSIKSFPQLVLAFFTKNPTKVVDRDTITSHYKPIKVYLRVSGKIKAFTARTTLELYTAFKRQYIENVRGTCCTDPHYFFERGNWTLFYYGKPLSKRNVALCDYNIQEGSIVDAISYYGLGGSEPLKQSQVKPVTYDMIVLPTYSIVKECEDRLTKIDFKLYKSQKTGLMVYRKINFRDVTKEDIDDDEIWHRYQKSILQSADEAQPASAVEFQKMIKMATQKAIMYLTDEKMEWFNIQVENWTVLLTFAPLCNNVADYLNLTKMAYRLFTGKSLSVLMSRKLKAYFANEVQSTEVGDILKVCRSAFDFTSTIHESEMSKRLVGLYSYLLTQGYLEKIGFTLNDEDYSKMEQRALLSAYSSKKSFIITVLETTLFICERIYEFQQTGEITSFLHSSSEYTKWIKEADRILNLAPFVGNLQAHNTSYFSFIGDLRDTIEKGDAYAKYVKNTSGIDSTLIARKLNSLRLLANTEITRRAAQQERVSPFGVLIHGSSSVGKSSFTKMLFRYYGALMDLDTDDCYRYVRNPMDEYWSNFDSSKWCIQLDDIAFKNPSKCADIDSTLQDLLNVVNNVPYVPPQAALEDKGRTPVLAELVLATSNCAHLNALEYFWCPLAVRRRLPYVINIKPKPEYLHENGIFLDPSKISESDGNFPDLWIIEVSAIVPFISGGRERAKLDVIETFTDVKLFLQHYGRACMNHKTNQARAMIADDNLSTISVCKVCYTPNCTSCVSVQYGTNDLYNWCGNILYNCFEWYVSLHFNMYILSIAIKYKCMRTFVMLIVNQLRNQTLAMNIMGRFSEGIQSKTFKYMILGLTLMIGGISIYHVVNKYPRTEKKKDEDMFNVQGNKFGTVEDQLTKEETSNVWYNPTVEITTFDTPVASASLANATPEMLRNVFARNCVLLRIQIEGQSSVRVMRGVFYKGHWLVTNGHAFKKEGETYNVKIIINNDSEGINANITMQIKRKDIQFSDTTDLCALEVSSLPPFKDISKYWCDSNIKPTSCVELIRYTNGEVQFNSIFALSHTNMEVEELGGNYNVFFGHSTLETEQGLCGSLNISNTPRGPIIIGLHFLGKDHHAGILDVKKSEIEKLIKNQRPVIQAGTAPRLDCEDRTHILGEVHHKSIIRYLPTGKANVYGSFVGFRPKPKSHVCATPLQEEMLQHFATEVGYDKPAMSGWEPWRNNVVQMVDKTINYDRTVLDECVREYANDIITSLPEGWEKELVVLSRESTVNGVAGVKFIDKIATNTSMGFPWNTTKKKYLSEAKTDKHPEGVDFGPEIWARVEIIIKTYEEGMRVYPIFSGHLKDEATALIKCELKKTRLFTGAPIDWSLVVRMHLLSFVRLLQKEKYIFEAAPGTVCQSAEWGQIYDYLTQHGTDRIVGGDYEKFDKKMLADFILAAFQVIILIHRAAGFDETFETIIAGIAEDVAFPVCNINGDLLEFFGTNPSGHPLTVVINSLVNSLYMRYCYHILNPKKEVKSFKSNVALMTYGDDNTMGINRSIDWFNHTSIQGALKTIGVGYTMADKTAKSIPFIDIKDVSFLKRSWRWSDDVNNYLCPLEEASIIKSLTVWVPSKSIDKYSQMVAVITSANNEYFFHGKEKFEEKHSFFKQTLEQEPFNLYVSEWTLPSYDELVERFKRASLSTSN